MLSTKTGNLARSVLRLSAPRISVICANECPGEFIGAKGTTKAKATLQKGNRFEDKLLGELLRLSAGPWCIHRHATGLCACGVVDRVLICSYTLVMWGDVVVV